MKLVRLLVVVLAIVFTSSSYALDTMGDSSCGKWVSDHTSNSVGRYSEEAWLTGLLSGMAIISNRDILRDTDGESVFLWMDC